MARNAKPPTRLLQGRSQHHDELSIPAVRFHVPVARLGIIHLIIWTGVAAVLLKYMEGMGALDRLNDAKNSTQWFFWTVNGLLSTIISATMLTGGCIVLWAKIRGQSGRLQPGHWMLLGTSLLTIISLPIWTIGIYIEDSLGPKYEGSYPGLEFYTYQVRAVLLDIATIVFYIVAAMNLKDAYCWRVAFWSFVVVSLISTFIDSMSILLMSAGLYHIGYQAWILSECPISKIVVFPVLCIAIWIDLKLHIRRDWLHWITVACIFIMGIWEIIAFTVRMFVPAVNAE